MAGAAALAAFAAVGGACGCCTFPRVSSSESRQRQRNSVRKKNPHGTAWLIRPQLVPSLAALGLGHPVVRDITSIGIDAFPQCQVSVINPFNPLFAVQQIT